MKRLLVGAALGALLLPAAAFAQDHDHECLNEACSVVALFQTAPSGGATTGWQGTEAPSYGTWGFDLAGRDMSVQPGDNFFRHSVGLTVDAMQIPSDRTSYGAFALLRELSDNRMRAIIDGLVARDDLTPGSDEAKIADLFRSYMDVERVEALDAQPLQPYLAEIRGLSDHAAMAAYMGRTQGRFGASFFGLGIGDDAKQPDRYVVYIGQSGLGMPNRDYYLQPRFAPIKAKYQTYVADMLGLLGWDDPAGNAERIVALETAIAEAHWTPEQSRNRDETYNEFTPASLAEAAPGFDWAGYLTEVGVGSVPRLVVRQDTALPAIAQIFADAPMATLQAWQAFRTADQAAPVLSARFSDLNWGFRARDLGGQPEQRARDKRAVTFAENGLPEGIGRLYAAEYFPPESKAKMEELVANLRLAMANRIRGLEWMGEETKAQALHKLENFGVKIGYPNRWRDYASIEARADDLFGNAERIQMYNWRYRLDRLNEPVDDEEWGMRPQTVNASYNSTKNEITFPAAILQPPFFDPDADPAVNYGAIGGVIGHEIGHGFDDQGRKSDGDGVLRDWWTAQDAANFVARTDRIGAQYETYAPLPGFNIKPGLTMGENIGDFAGIFVGLEAYHLSLNGQPSPVLDGISGDQRFFYGWAQVWASKYREQAMQQLIASDPHSPPEFRVIGPVRNHDAWYDAFDVQPGQAYYLAPADRVRLW